MLYHLLSATDVAVPSERGYRAGSLETEGFIHCSYESQVLDVARRFFANEISLAVLVIDPALLSSIVRDEDPGTGELFPHVYGPIDGRAIVDVKSLRKDALGNWKW